jgi:hypothetical protein
MKDYHIEKLVMLEIQAIIKLPLNPILSKLSMWLQKDYHIEKLVMLEIQAIIKLPLNPILSKLSMWLYVVKDSSMPLVSTVLYQSEQRPPTHKPSHHPSWKAPQLTLVKAPRLHNKQQLK